MFIAISYFINNFRSPHYQINFFKIFFIDSLKTTYFQKAEVKKPPIEPEPRREIQPQVQVPQPIVPTSSDLEKQLIAKLISGENTSDAYMIAMKTLNGKDNRKDLNYYS